MRSRRVLRYGLAALAFLGIMAGLRPMRAPAGVRLRPTGKAIHDTKRPEARVDSAGIRDIDAGETRPVSSGNDAILDLRGLDASDLRARLENAGSSDTVLATVFVLGNTTPIGPKEVEVLLGALARWSNEGVRCQVLWALGLARETYPLAKVLDLLRNSASVEVRCAAVASMAGHLDDFMKRVLREELSSETDPRLCHEIERSLSL